MFLLRNEIITILNLVFVYENIKDLKNDENQKLTTYGTSIIRGIKSIIMENGNYIEKVDNMDYYELLKEKGYIIIGYEVINPYSLNYDGNLSTEFYVKEDDTKLVLTPFK